MHGRLDLYEFAAGKNYHNFEMEYAMSLQQVSTSYWIKIFNLAPSLNTLSVVWVIYRQRSLLLSIKSTAEDAKGHIRDSSTSQNTLHGR